MKMNQKIAQQIQKIDAQITALGTQYEIKDTILRNQYCIEHTPENIESWSENDWEYCEHRAELFYELDYQTSKLNAQKAADMLIGYNIARRGKPLHESAVLKKTAKLGADGQFIREQMMSSRNSPMLLAVKSYLHTALKKYRITLFDSNYFQIILDAMNRLSMTDMAPEKKDKIFNKYAVQLNLFHSAIHNKFAIR